MSSQICSFNEWFFALTTFVLPEWVRKWVLLITARLNFLLRCAHVCFFSPLWMSRWVLRFPVWLNDFTHFAHLWAFSPECASRCFLRFVASLNDFSHWVHLCWISSGCVCKRVLIWETWLNDLFHSVQLWASSPLWVLRFPHIFRSLGMSQSQCSITMLIWNAIIQRSFSFCHHGSNLINFWCILM